MNEVQINPVIQVILDMIKSGASKEEIAETMAAGMVTQDDLKPFIVKGESHDPKTEKPVITLKSATDFDEEAAARVGTQTVANKTANELMASMAARNVKKP